MTTSYAGLDGETQTIRTLTKSTSFQQPLENIATTYSLTVAASSDVGTSSPESVSYNPATAMPSEPLSLMVTPGADDSVTVSWQPPLYAGPPGASIAYYEATNWQSGETQKVSASSTSVVFTGIEPRDASLFTVRAYNDISIAGGGLLAQIAVDQTGQQLPLPPSNPFMGVEGLSTMHANAASSDVTLFPGPGTESVQVSQFKNLGAAMPSILMTENGALVCVGVGTGEGSKDTIDGKNPAKVPVVMLISPVSLEVLDKLPLVKPQNAEGDLAGGIYNFIDYQNRLVLVDANGQMCWYGNIYDPISDTGILVQEGQVDLAAKAGLADGELNLVVGLVPDYEGRIWFATEGNIDEKSPKRTDKHVVTPMVGYYDPRNGVVSVTGVPPIPNYIPAMIANSISSSPAGVAVATSQALYLFRAEDDGSITTVWQNQYQNSNYRKPGQLSPGTGSTPVFFGPSTGYEYLVITDNATTGGNNEMPAENILVYRVSDGSLVSEEPFLNPEAYNAGTENAPIAFGNRIIIPSTYGYWYPPPSETTTSVPKYATFVGGIQNMTIDSGGAQTLAWTSTVPSSALPRLSLADNNIYTVEVSLDSDNSTTFADYYFAVIDSETGAADVSTSSMYIGQNTWGGKTPDLVDRGEYSLNTLQMTGVISPSGVFYQGTGEGIFMVSSIPTSAPQNLTATPVSLNGLDIAWSRPEEVYGGSGT
ncbi:MAG: fibronectin type III domain-containing protein, partial [Pirellulales bacterium]|nr:fibronectin type III domain-containing protein [Pirellulales bacterium]